jgi:hypothetical protein
MMKSRIVAVDEIAQAVGDGGGYFVCSASYEERSLVIPLRLAPEGFDKVIICENENHRDIHGNNGDRLRSHFKDQGSMAWLNTDNPLITGDSLFNALGRVPGTEVPRIVIDISSFTHESLLMMFRVIYQAGYLERTILLYTRAREYSIGDPEHEKWLSKGVGEIRSVLGFPGRVYPSRPLHLLVLVGLEYQRTIDIIGRYEPSEISLGYGTSSISLRGFSKVNAIYGNATRFTFQPLDVCASLESIVDEVGRVTDHNIILAPMNTKLSTIAAALAACENGDIQICYAKAIVYNYRHYSIPGDEVFVVSFEE